MMTMVLQTLSSNLRALRLILKTNYKTNINYAWAVQSGDVSAVPAAVWLFSSDLIGLIGLA